MQSAIRRRTDGIGRVVIPIGMRKSLNFEERQRLEIYDSNNTICLAVAGESKLNKGICRRIDELGRILVPVEMRNTFNIKIGSFVEIYLDNNIICLRPVSEDCVFCGEENKNNLVSFRGKKLCTQCMLELIAAQNLPQAKGKQPISLLNKTLAF